MSSKAAKKARSNSGVQPPKNSKRPRCGQKLGPLNPLDPSPTMNPPTSRGKKKTVLQASTAKDTADELPKAPFTPANNNSSYDNIDPFPESDLVILSPPTPKSHKVEFVGKVYYDSLKISTFTRILDINDPLESPTQTGFKKEIVQYVLDYKNYPRDTPWYFGRWKAIYSTQQSPDDLSIKGVIEFRQLLDILRFCSPVKAYRVDLKCQYLTDSSHDYSPPSVASPSYIKIQMKGKSQPSSVQRRKQQASNSNLDLADLDDYDGSNASSPPLQLKSTSRVSTTNKMLSVKAKADENLGLL